MQMICLSQINLISRILSFRNLELDGMSGVKKSFGKQFSLSSGVLDLIMKSWYKITAKQCAPQLRRWSSFCSENGLDPLNADVARGAEFLTQYFRKSSCEYSSANTQPVQLCHRFSQQSMDLTLVNNL